MVPRTDGAVLGEANAALSPTPAPRRRDLRAIAAYVLAGLIVVLNVLYLTIGDRTPLTEYLTIWPPVLWLGLLAVVAVPLFWRQRRGPALVLAGALVLFALALIEWRALLRWGVREKSSNAVRVMTWNIGGGYTSKGQLLDEMAAWQPDIVFLQETPDGAASFNEDDLTGHWQGFTWIDAGDCGLLSRWPMRELLTEQVGPWSKPQAVAIDGPWEAPLLAINARLMLPSLELAPFTGRAWGNLVEANRQRVAQFPSLVQLVDKRLEQESFGGVMLGGDFNTDASARSLLPMRGELADVWRVAGRGWGATATREFPVARIDHLYISDGLVPTQAFVARSSLSDHRPLAADLVVD
jgi:endonuclease/exonuclease/phosphatase (EEP) superfamily protein YafD